MLNTLGASSPPDPTRISLLPPKLLSDNLTSALSTAAPSEKPRYYCERSRYTLVSPAQDGVRRLFHAPCKSNRCPYCGRVNMYRKRNRLYGRIQQDRETGLAEKTAYEFVTTTVRPDAMTVEQAYKWIKPAMSYAIQKVRKPRKWTKNMKRAAWGGCELEYVNDVDVQPNTKMPHVHALYGVRFPDATKRNKGVEKLKARYSKRMAQELHYYANNWLRKRLGLPTMRWREGQEYPYQGKDSILYVHFSAARSTENCLMYMSLHNGKIWTDGREYPRGYRRFATSRGFLPKQETEPTGFEFVKQRLDLTLTKLMSAGVKPDFTGAERGHDGKLLAVSIPDPGQAYHCWETESGVQRQVDTSGGYRLAYALGRAPGQKLLSKEQPDGTLGTKLAADVQARMEALERFWESGYQEEGVSFEAWQAGAVLPSLAATMHPLLGEQEVALARDLQNVAPSLSDEQARAWVRDVARIRARKEMLAKQKAAKLQQRRC